MRRAVAALGIMPDIALVDGNVAPSLPCPVKTVVKGDALSFSIAASLGGRQGDARPNHARPGVPLPPVTAGRPMSGIRPAEHFDGIGRLGVTTASSALVRAGSPGAFRGPPICLRCSKASRSPPGRRLKKIRRN